MSMKYICDAYGVPAKRGIMVTESKIKRLANYYKAQKRLDQDWRFDPKKGAMFLE